MSDLLSQDEIDALLHGVDDVEEEELEEDSPKPRELLITTFLRKIALCAVVCQRWKWLTSVLLAICVLAYLI